MRGVRSALVLLALAAPAACSEGDEAGAPAPDRALVAEAAWSRPTPPGAERAVAYLVVRTDRPDAVTAARVDAAVAAAASLHRTMVHDSSGSHHGGGASEMSMEPVDSLPVDPSEPLVFEPGGNHVMLEGLAAPLTRGARYGLTLELESGRRLVVPVVVADEAPGP